MHCKIIGSSRSLVWILFTWCWLSEGFLCWWIVCNCFSRMYWPIVVCHLTIVCLLIHWPVVEPLILAQLVASSGWWVTMFWDDPWYLVVKCCRCVSVYLQLFLTLCLLWRLWVDFFSRLQHSPKCCQFQKCVHDHGLRPGMVVEVVNKVCVSAMTVATISEIIGGRLRLSYLDKQVIVVFFHCFFSRSH